MGMYVNELCRSLPDWIFGLSVIGGLVVYLIIGLLVAYMVKLWKDNINIDIFILVLIFWPAAVIVGIAIGVVSAVSAILYYVCGYIFKLFAGPIINVDKADLRASEERIIDSIDTKITREDNKIMDYLEYDYVPSKAKKKAKKPVKAKKAKAVKKKKGKK